MAERVKTLQGAELEQMVRDAAAPDLLAALQSLGRAWSVDAADALARVDALPVDRVARKEARRQLHRLEAAGVRPRANAMGASQESGAGARPQLTADSVWVTDYDGAGARTLWLVGDRPLGGAAAAGVVLNDLHGLEDVTLQETTRKRFAQMLDEWRADRRWSWVETPASYVLELVREAVDTSRAQGTPLPTSYSRFRSLFGEAEHAPERALIYDLVSVAEVTFHPEWLEESGNLVHEPEITRWYLEPSETLRARVLDVVRSTRSPLLVPGNTPQDKLWALLQDASREMLGDREQQALRRRLEETAYVFARTDRLASARLAVAAARGLMEHQRPLLEHPLVRDMLTVSLVTSVRNEVVDGQPAYEILLSLLGRLWDTDERPTRPAGGGPGGLILPR